MKTATLVVNPAARGAPSLRKQMPAITALLSGHGYTTSVTETTAATNSAGVLAAAAARTSSLVLACGGDGTVHGVVQGLAGTAVPLGIVPLGTANALARNLGLPLDPLAAVARLMSYTPRLLPLGEITSAAGSRLFAVMAGCGPDGALVHTLSGGSQLKARFGRVAYYGHAARLFCTRRWPTFRVEYRQTASNVWVDLDAVGLLVSRVPDLGGMFSGLTPHASLMQDRLHVQILRPPARLSMAAWWVNARMGFRNPWLLTEDVEEVRCSALAGEVVYGQADAEPLGTLPFSLRIVPEALWLLMA